MSSLVQAAIIIDDYTMQSNMIKGIIHAVLSSSLIIPPISYERYESKNEVFTFRNSENFYSFTAHHTYNIMFLYKCIVLLPVTYV